uniref:Protein translocase subunit SecA n=1 Tax=Flintiella sanguinaria TaxID=101926 RepID=A0A1X9PUI3_9RHOD|nr:preprotein translocase subunit secA [Flintiella sanguinaria]
MFNFLSNGSEKELRECNNLVQKINLLETKYLKISDEELKNKTNEFRKQLNNSKNLDDILVEAFATVREVTRRLLNIRLFDVQLVGGIVLHHGKISEMKTGEGKTLVATLPAYLNALNNNGVHIVTVNDYLARRDSEQIGPIYKFLGLTVGLIQENMDTITRKKNYSCDITYVTNSQLGFDYLRENMATSLDQLVLKSLAFCIIDEIDSVLIDEARTPLIISGPGSSSSDRYVKANILVKSLVKDIDYEVDKKNQTITLTDKGLLTCEKYLNVKNIYDINNPWASFILNAIKAQELYIRDRNYIVKDKEVIIVDENTGRIMTGRRWSDGLHQSIEAKEEVKIQDETKTLASITYQNFFLLYNKLSGMTGTAKTEEIEFEKIYSLNVIVIPTNKTMIRRDLPDLIYKSQSSKWKAIANECYDMFNIGRPVLIGTTSVEYSELLSSLLKHYQINHNLLNAKPENTIRESEIIAQAGRKSMITIATNMAGRGTDIILGGNPEYISKSILRYIFQQNVFNIETFKYIISQFKIPPFDTILQDKLSATYLIVNSSSIDLSNCQSIINSFPNRNNENKLFPNNLFSLFQELYVDLYRHISLCTEEEKMIVKDLGGLYVIGTERHSSRRIDNQLRGRAGRQGDPGESRFFLSLDDTLFQRFPVERLKNVLDTLQLEDETPIQSPLLMKTLESSQKKIESYYFDQRKNIFDYDQVLNRQRQAVYTERRKMLQAKYLKYCILQYGKSLISDLLDTYVLNNTKSSKNIELFLWSVQNLLGIGEQVSSSDIKYMSSDFLYAYFYEQFDITYSMKEIYVEFVIPGAMLEIERFYLLLHIDNSWTEHLSKMSTLMDSVGWRAYGQEDPFTEYKYDAFRLFIVMTVNVRQAVMYSLLGLNLVLN